jgi:UDP-glucose 4-epimerase
MKNDHRVVLLTGANGFVGRNVAPVLTANGMIVRQAMRKPSSQPNSVIVNAIGPQTDWNEALFGVDAVVHLAARVHHPHEENAQEVYRSINTDGTLHLARCAAKAGVRQFIFLSSLLVNGNRPGAQSPAREDDRPVPRGIYGMSKAAAEAGLEAIANDTDMRVTVIRPPLIYGVGARGNFEQLVKAVERGVPLPFGSIHNRRAFLGIENLSSFIVHQLAHPGGKFDLFLLADNEQVSTPEFVRLVARTIGKEPRIVPIPLFLLNALFTICGRFEAYNSVVGSMEVDTSKALNTGWRPQFSLQEGLRRTLQKNRVKMLK